MNKTFLFSFLSVHLFTANRMITTIRSLIIVQSPPTGVRVFPSSATNTSRLYPLLTRAFTCCAGQCLAAKDNRRASHIQVSRDRKPNSKSPGNLERDQTLRKEVMNEVAIPGKYQLYFKPDKRAIRKAVSWNIRLGSTR